MTTVQNSTVTQMLTAEEGETFVSHHSFKPQELVLGYWEQLTT